MSLAKVDNITQMRSVCGHHRGKRCNHPVFDMPPMCLASTCPIIKSLARAEKITSERMVAEAHPRAPTYHVGVVVGEYNYWYVTSDFLSPKRVRATSLVWPAARKAVRSLLEDGIEDVFTVETNLQASEPNRRYHKVSCLGSIDPA